MSIHYIISWSKLDHIHSFRLRLVFAPCCPDHFTTLYYHFRWVFIAPFSIQYFDFKSHGGEYIASIIFVHAQVLNSIYCLSCLTTKLSLLYYHGPLIILPSESEWIDLLRVTPPFVFGLLQQNYGCISCLIYLECLVNTHLGPI